MPSSNPGQGRTSSVAEGSPYARHIPALDGIRGLAVLGVAVSHLFPGTPTSSLMRGIAHANEFGGAGVDLFFVLSGFLITGILFDSLGDSRYFRKFYARRVLRIFPLYYAVIAVFTVYGLIYAYSWRGELLSLGLYLQNTSLIATRINDYKGTPSLPLPHFWSLAIEEQFYLVWPMLVYFVRKRKHLVLMCAASLALCPAYRFWMALHGAGRFDIQTNTIARADSLFIGGILALLLRSRLHDQTLKVAKVVFFLAGTALLVGLVLIPEGINKPETLPAWGFALRYTLLDVACVGLLGVALAGGVPRTFFSIRPLRELGKYSYGFYVLHLIIFSYMQVPFKNFLAAHVTSSKGLGVVLDGLTAFAVSITAAYVSYQVYERQFLRLKRYFDYRPHSNTAS